MGWRADDANRTALRRAWGAVVRDAADIAGARLVELRLGAPRAEGGGPWESVAFAAPGLSGAARAELARALARDPAAAALPTARPRTPPRLAPCASPLARALGAGRLRALHQVFVPLGGGGPTPGWLRIVGDGPPGRAALRLFRALARQAEGRLEAEALRRELASRHRRAARAATREQRAAEELAQAKDALAALNLAGLHLMVETDGRAILNVICRELLRLGFHSAVLVAAPDAARAGGAATADGAPRPFRYAATSFSAKLQRATERVVGVPLASVPVDPATAPLVERVLRRGRTVYTARAREAARQLFGGLDERRIGRLERLLGLRHVIVAPLRYAGGISGLLVVATARLRRGDPSAIDAFAMQASIALEKARLFAELREHQALLESEVDARTEELRRAVRALQEADRRKDNFLANVSHELRTPLVTVMGYTDLLLSEKAGALSAKQRDCLRVASSSARRLRSFIDELLELSRYELTKDRFHFGPLDPAEVVGQAALAIAPRFHERGLELRTRVSPRAREGWGDRDRLVQVLTNLLTNAERYCVKGGHVRVAAARGRDGGIAFSVADDGAGIAPEHLERIFDRLYQVGDEVAPRDKGAGLGLGLSIVKGIAEAHGGAVRVRSRVGRGTTFRVDLPRAPAEG